MKAWLWISMTIAVIPLTVVGFANSRFESPNAQPDAVSSSRLSDGNADSSSLAISSSGAGAELKIATSSSTVVGQVPVSLVPPTSITERLPQIQSGRGDPFAPLGTATPILIQGAGANFSDAALPSIPVSATPSYPPTPVQTLPIAALPPTQFNPLPSAEVAPPALPSAPTSGATSPPAAAIPLARSIEISGVVEIGNQVSVIVRVPNERSSRYARVGERLANGQVLVKRVEMETSAEPIVVLEQEGVEIVRTVGSSINTLSSL